MKISAIVTTFNRRAALARTLATLFGQDFPADRFEIVVVVDGSTDGTVEYLRGLELSRNLRTIAQSNQGEAAARDVGLHAARGEIVLFLDDDLVCDEHLLAAHVAAHQCGISGLVFGPILLHPESARGLVAEWLHRGFDEWFSRVTPQNEGSGFFFCMGNPNTSAPRQLLISGGGFDKRFRRYDDVDLGFRLWRSGVRFRYQPQAVVYHLFTKNAFTMVRSDFVEDGRSEVRLCRKNPAYRQFSLLKNFTRGSTFKGALRHAAVALWPATDWLLAAPCSLAERCSSIQLVKRVGLKLLGWRMAGALFNGAIQEAGSWEAFRREFAMRLPVLAYHYVGRRVSGTWPSLTISPDLFEWHLRWLVENGYTGIHTVDWWQWVQSGKDLPAKPVLLTFDDAYAELVKYALPALRRYGMKATIFVVTDHIGQSSSWDLPAGYPAIPLMTEEDIRKWEGQNIEFAAHSRTHRDLRAAPDVDITSELEGSKKALSNLLSTTVHSFAYPFGSYDERVHRCAAEHFDVALTIDPGLNGSATNLHQLRRNIVSTPSHLLFPIMVRFGWNTSEALTSIRARAKSKLVNWRREATG